jgi:hypothetical protein
MAMKQQKENIDCECQRDLVKKQQGMRLPSKERHSCASCMVDALCADEMLDVILRVS